MTKKQQTVGVAQVGTPSKDPQSSAGQRAECRGQGHLRVQEPQTKAASVMTKRRMGRRGREEEKREEKWENGETRGIFIGEGEEEEEQGLKGKGEEGETCSSC